MSVSLTVRVNSQDRTATVEPRTHLADMLREEMLLTGTHLGCEHGVCGACTLMLDGRPVRSCLTLAAACAGAEVRTIEGFDDDALMAALRRAFSRHHALQCGYCTPGMLVTAYDIVRRLPGADEARIRAELAGNLCRCTGYAGIVAAIAEVAAGGLVAELQPSARAVAAPGRSVPITRARQGEAAAARPWVAPDLAGATTLSRQLALPMRADTAWRVLRDASTVVSCVPGAALTSFQNDELEGSLTVSIGPMRASFRGRARIVYDDPGYAGVLSGSADDAASRSAAAGMMKFRVAAGGADRCTVHADISYRLNGPLAQAGRPAIVADVVDQMLSRFTANVLAAASGKTVDARPMSGLRIVAAVFFSALRRLFGRT